MRIVPVNKRIAVERGVTTYDQIRAHVQQSPGPFAAIPCICRDEPGSKRIPPCAFPHWPVFGHNYFTPPIFLIPKPQSLSVTRKVTIHRLLCGVERLLKTDRVCAIAAAAAHGLNNELTVILNSVSNSIPTLEPGHPARPDLLDLQLAVLRCSRISSALLEFSARNGARPPSAPFDHLVKDE